MLPSIEPYRAWIELQAEEQRRKEHRELKDRFLPTSQEKNNEETIQTSSKAQSKD